MNTPKPKRWFLEEEDFSQLCVLTHDCFYTAWGNPADNESAAAIKTLVDGDYPSESREYLARVPIVDIQSVSKDELSEFIRLNYLENGKMTNCDFKVHFKKRQKAFDCVARELGESSKRYTERIPFLEATWGAAVSTILIAVGTWFFWDMAASLDPNQANDRLGRAGKMKRVVYGLLEILGPTGVLVVGCILLCFSGFVLYRRIQHPPTRLVVERISQGATD